MRGSLALMLVMQIVFMAVGVFTLVKNGQLWFFLLWEATCVCGLVQTVRRLRGAPQKRRMDGYWTYPDAPPAGQSAQAQLKQLKRLRKKGLITELEYEQKRQEVLRRL